MCAHTYVRMCVLHKAYVQSLPTHVSSPHSLTLTPPLPRRNEEMDDKVLIKRLKKRVAELEAEVEQLRQELSSPQQQVVSSGHTQVHTTLGGA